MKKGFQFSSHPVSAYLVYTGEAPISIVGVCRYSKVAQALAKEKNAKIYFMDSANSMSGLNRKYRTKQIAPFGHTFVSYNYEAGQIEYAITYVYKKEAFNRIYSLENTIKSMNKMQNMNYDIELMESDDGNTASLYVDGKVYASVHKSKVYARKQYESYGADEISCGHEECNEMGMDDWLSDREIVFKYFTQWRNNDNRSFKEAYFTDSPVKALNALSLKDMNDIANEQRENVGCYRWNWEAESYGADEDYEDYEYIMTIVTKTDGRIEIERWETHPLVLLGQKVNLKSFEKNVIKEFKELVREADGNYADDLVSATLEKESYSDYDLVSSKTIARYIHFDDDVMSKDEPHGFEIFNVEFNDWAKQEMLTHGEDISFKEWAQDESEKHGDMDLEDWAEHEEESHDERYGADEYDNQPKAYKMRMGWWIDNIGGREHESEKKALAVWEEAINPKDEDEEPYDFDPKKSPYQRMLDLGLKPEKVSYGAEDIKHYEKLPSDMPDATIYDFAVDKGDEKSRLDFAKEILEEEFSSKTHKIISYNDDFDQMFYRIVKKDEYGAETFEAEHGCPICKGEVHGDMSMIGEEIIADICGDCDIYIMPQFVSCIECGFGDPYGSATSCESCEEIAEQIETINRGKGMNAETFGAERYWDKDTDSYREIYKHSIEVREFPKSSSVYQNGKLVKQYKGQGHFTNATAYAQKLENDYVPKSFFAEGKRREVSELVCYKCGVKDEQANYNWNTNAKGCCGMGVREKRYYINSENMTSKLKSPYVIGAFAIGLGIPYITSFLNSKKDK
tara:strand:- start:155 stop:2536 length:2382 start_codon:yes stop_codon:yes gene_type:complete